MDTVRRKLIFVTIRTQRVKQLEFREPGRDREASNAGVFSRAFVWEGQIRAPLKTLAWETRVRDKENCL